MADRLSATDGRDDLALVVFVLGVPLFACLLVELVTRYGQ